MSPWVGTPSATGCRWSVGSTRGTTSYKTSASTVGDEISSSVSSIARISHVIGTPRAAGGIGAALLLAALAALCAASSSCPLAKPPAEGLVASWAGLRGLLVETAAPGAERWAASPPEAVTMAAASSATAAAMGWSVLAHGERCGDDFAPPAQPPATSAPATAFTPPPFASWPVEPRPLWAESRRRGVAPIVDGSRHVDTPVLGWCQ